MPSYSEDCSTVKSQQREAAHAMYARIRGAKTHPLLQAPSSNQRRQRCRKSLLCLYSSRLGKAFKTHDGYRAMAPHIGASAALEKRG